MTTENKFIYYDKSNTVKIISTSKFSIIHNDNIPIIESEDEIKLNDKLVNKSNQIRLAFIANYNQKCGIATYSKYIITKLKSYVDSYQIFSEVMENIIDDNDYNFYLPSWNRGEPLDELLFQIKLYKPTHILIQHEWGVFPNIVYFMSFITQLKQLNIPIIVVLHSVYSHLDKLIPLSILDNVIVHSNEAKDLLWSLDFKGDINVIPHGCPDVNIEAEIYNIFKTPYVIFGYGFGFKYKGVEIAIDAIDILIKSNPIKYKNLVYIYCCGESENNKGIHENYYSILFDKVQSLNLQNNIILIKGFLPDSLLDIYLRTVKMVVFPYLIDQDGVRGASGAIKIAMSYKLPVIASKSHLFDDVENYVTKINNSEELAAEIDKIFSNSDYKEQLVNKEIEYVQNNSWEISASKYINYIKSI